METRMAEISKYIKLHKNVKLAELEALFPDISTMTLRRDLSKLEDIGEIVRTHGGARSVDDISRIKEELYTQRALENTDRKSVIAKKSINIPRIGHTIFLDTGTTIAALAELLTDEKLLVLTPAPNIAIECAKKPNVTVFVTGGFLNNDNLSLSGEWDSSFMADVSIDVAYMASSAYSLPSGFTCGSYNESVIKKEIISKATKVVMLMDGTKLDKSMPFTFARPKDIDVFVTDNVLPEEVSSEFINNKVEVL